MKIAGRILFDTNLVNLTLDCGEYIFDGGEIPAHLPGTKPRRSLTATEVDDVTALRGMFLTGQRASWQLAISPLTYQEIDATRDDARRTQLMRWFNELWMYWREFFEADKLSDQHADSLARRLVGSDYLAPIPQTSDRVLVAHAIAYGCDAFCTRDRKTILRHRQKLRGVPLRFLSPTEWWQEVMPMRLWV